MVGKGVPLGRIGSPEDVAGLAIFLSSRAGAYLTGAVIPCDGGISTKSG
jgi:NAD(P)-dependent dehydrogenase (short-subunit alcohol dehydrogenase family)